MRLRILGFIGFVWLGIVALGCHDGNAVPTFDYRQLPSKYSESENTRHVSQIDTIIRRITGSEYRIHFNKVSLVIDSLTISNKGYCIYREDQERVTSIGFIPMDRDDINDIVELVGYDSVAYDTTFLVVPFVTPDTLYAVNADTTYTVKYRNSKRRVYYIVFSGSFPSEIVFGQFPQK
jgi:hypothetical protein